MAATKPRVNWIDAVKGLTIILVVMKHTTYGDAVALHATPYLFNFLCEWVGMVLGVDRQQILI